jgi:hypothetical protein
MPTLKAQQGRHNLDLQSVRDIEPGVVDAPGHGFGETGIVLGVNPQSDPPRQIAEHRRGQFAGGTIAFDDRYETVL